MRAAVLYDADDIRIEERPVPAIGPGELLVEARAAGICTGDVMAWYVKRKAPLVLGHEPAGVVAAIGEGVEHFAPGDRVFVHHHAPCFACRACSRGDYVQCAGWRASRIDPGAMAQYFRVPRENVADTLRLPDGVPFEDGSLTEPLACVVKSLRRSGVHEGDTLHVVGLGVMGLMHALVAQSRGIEVSGSDLIPSRRDFAQKLGIAVFEPENAPHADVVICGPGTPGALAASVQLANPGGTVVIFTPFEPGAPLGVEPNELYFRDVSLVPSYSCGPPDTRESLDLIARGVVTAQRLGATRCTLDDVPAAYAALRRCEIMKPIVIL